MYCPTMDSFTDYIKADLEFQLFLKKIVENYLTSFLLFLKTIRHSANKCYTSVTF